MQYIKNKKNKLRVEIRQMTDYYSGHRETGRNNSHNGNMNIKVKEDFYDRLSDV